jgi:hypothetical protein
LAAALVGFCAFVVSFGGGLLAFPLCGGHLLFFACRKEK